MRRKLRRELRERDIRPADDALRGAERGSVKNMSGLALRREAVGRKNWLFVGSDDGGVVNAIFTSLLASCRMHGIEPWTCLRDLFCVLPHCPAHRLIESLH